MMTELDFNSEGARFACGAWLLIGLVGASALVAGLVELFDGATTWYSALALAFFGLALAVVSWRHSWTVLEQAERTSFGVNDAARKPNPSRQPRSRGIAQTSSRRISDDHGHSTAD